MRERVKGWPGYVHRQANGEPLFIIEKQITLEVKPGQKVRHRFHLSTGCNSIGPALKQLERFQADPFAYSRAGADVRAPLLLDVDMALKLYRWQVAERPNGKGLSRKYAREVNTWLTHWMRSLRGVDLRRLQLARDVLPVLDGLKPGARRPMMAALKTLFGWLRTERHELTAAEDVSRDLKLPQSDPAKRQRRVAHDIADVRKVLARLEGVYRDALLFQWATSCHVSELERFVRDERSRLVVFDKPERLADGTKALAVVELWHKTQEWHRIALTRREHVEAAQRLRERRSLPTRSDLNHVIYAACAAAGVERMSYVMRHTTLTRAAARGIDRERRMAHARHKNVATAERYVDVQLPLAAIPAEKL